MKFTKMIKVVGLQTNAEGEESKIELMTEGTLYKKNEVYYILYDESEISGMEGSTTRVKIENKNKISMKRFGTSSADLIFEQGKTYETTYMTAYGDINMIVNTDKLDVDISDETGKGNVEIIYDLDISGNTKVSNQLKIQLM